MIWSKREAIPNQNSVKEKFNTLYLDLKPTSPYAIDPKRSHHSISWRPQNLFSPTPTQESIYEACLGRKGDSACYTLKAKEKRTRAKSLDI